MAQKLLGFDLGRYELKIAQVKGDKLTKFAVEQMPDNLIKEGRIISYNAMADFLKEAVKKHKMSGKKAVVALPPETYYLRRIKLPVMTIQQMKVNLPFEFRDYVTGELSDYVYDYALLGMDESGMDIMAAASSKKNIQSFKDMMRRAGLKLVKLVPDVLGLQSILMPDGAGPTKVTQDYAVLDLGHSSTRMYFFSNGAYEITRTMDSGGPAMARAIADEKGVDIHIAQLYLEHNQDNVRELPIMVDMYDEIVTEVMRVMNFYSYNNPSNSIDKIYFMGGAVDAKRLSEGVKEAIGLDMLPLSSIIPGTESFGDLILGPQAYGIVTE